MSDQKKIRPKTYSARITRKYNLGNYESEEIDVMMVAEADPDVDPQDAFDYVLSHCMVARSGAEVELGLRPNTPTVSEQTFYKGKPIQQSTQPSWATKDEINDF